VLAMAFCHRELGFFTSNEFSFAAREISLRQNAATSTPDACTPQKALALAAKHD